MSISQQQPRAVTVAAVAALVLVVAVILTSIQPRSGQAHAGYESSEPAADSTVTIPPTEVVVYFTREVDPNGVMVAVLGPNGDRVDLQDAAVDLCDPFRKRVTVSLPPAIPNGEYIVQWETMSLEDAEQDSGFFTFTVNAPEGSPEASPPASPEASPEASPDASPTAAC